MAERRSFSRNPRKALDAEERRRLIEAMLDEEFGETSVAVTPIDFELDPPVPLAPVDTLEERSETDATAQIAPEPDLDVLDDAAFDEALREISAGALASDAEIEQEQLEGAYEEAVAEAEVAVETEPEAESVAAAGEALPEVGPDADAQKDSTFELTRSHLAEPPETASDPAPLPDAASQEKLRAAYEMAAADAAPEEPADKWDVLDVLPVDAPHLERNLIITAARNEPAHGAFDVLRTRLVQTLLEHGWKRVAITSPTRDCGKTFTAVNLAISLSRYEANRTILLDFDMRNPSVADVIGDTRPGKMGDFLRGTVPAEDLLVKFDRNDLNIGPSLAIGTNDVIEPYAAELAHEPSTGRSLERMMEAMSPDIVLFDMPPALAFDDVIAFRKHFDGVLMVVGGGETSPEEVREVMRRLGEDTPLLGVVLNQAEGEDGSDYSYGY